MLQLQKKKWKESILYEGFNKFIHVLVSPINDINDVD